METFRGKLIRKVVRQTNDTQSNPKPVHPCMYSSTPIRWEIVSENVGRAPQELRAKR